ncbi:MAG: hypothetical protein ACXWCY_25865 [Burkholderiales bacterium]
MTSRKSTLPEPESPPATDMPAREGLAGSPQHTRALKGNSETHFTRAELERMVLEGAYHELDEAALRSVLIDRAWEHGRVTPEADGEIWRQDACGAWMRREQIGRQTDFGWKIVSISTEGEHTAESLRPFHWRNDFDIANGKPHCHTSADRTGVPGEEQASPPRNRET